MQTDWLALSQTSINTNCTFKRQRAVTISHNRTGQEAEMTKEAIPSHPSILSPPRHAPGPPPPLLVPLRLLTHPFSPHSLLPSHFEHSPPPFFTLLPPPHPLPPRSPSPTRHLVFLPPSSPPSLQQPPLTSTPFTCSPKRFGKSTDNQE